MKKKHVLFAILCCILVLLLPACAAENPVESTRPTTIPPAASVTTPPLETTSPAETTSPQLPDGAYPEGTYEIGTQIMDQTYVFIPYDPAQIASIRVTRDSETVLKQSFTGQFFWTPKEGDTVTAEGAYLLCADGYTVQVNPNGSYGPGMYRIGTDIPEGYYLVSPLSGDPSAEAVHYHSLSDKSRSSKLILEECILRGGSDTALYLENCSLTLFDPANAPFTIPAAPEAAEVRALPAEFDVSTLVYPFYEQGMKFGVSHTYYISIPAIFPFSEEAVACQQEIYNDFAECFEWYSLSELSMHYYGNVDFFDMTGISSDTKDGHYFGYTASYNGNVLQILVQLADPIAGRTKYKVYDLNVPN